jgi:hypothetical protein
MSPDISIKPVSSSSEMDAFVKLPWRLYQRDPKWVPPMLFDVKRRLSRKDNHFFGHGEGEYFLAWRGSTPVGRITAQVDFNYDQHWGGKTGMFGWFEAEDDPAIARGLFDAASDWLRKKGRDKMQGPFNFNINDECGLLIDGFDTPPMMMMTHNPPYYRKLIEDLGLKKAQDLFAYRLDTTADAPEDVVKYAALVRAREDVEVRPWNMKDFKREMERWLEVYNSAWEKNWGSVKMNEDEFMAHAFDLRWLSDPALNFMAETRSGEVMGCAMTLPNLNEYIGPAGGRLSGLLPFKWYDMIVKKKFKSCRVVTLGVKEKFRRSGVGAIFYYETLMAAKRRGYEWGEMSWILESNGPMNRAIQHMGGKVYKTYRIYETAV